MPVYDNLNVVNIELAVILLSNSIVKLAIYIVLTRFKFLLKKYNSI